MTNYEQNIIESYNAFVKHTKIVYMVATIIPLVAAIVVFFMSSEVSPFVRLIFTVMGFSFIGLFTYFGAMMYYYEKLDCDMIRRYKLIVK